jgi:hypothetical protein
LCRWQNELGEGRRGPLGRDSGQLLIERDQTVAVVGDDADRGELHSSVSFGATSFDQIITLIISRIRGLALLEILQPFGRGVATRWP